MAGSVEEALPITVTLGLDFVGGTSEGERTLLVSLDSGFVTAIELSEGTVVRVSIWTRVVRVSVTVFVEVSMGTSDPTRSMNRFESLRYVEEGISIEPLDTVIR
jgi:hypothetical protein